MNIKLTVLGLGAALAIGGCTSTTPNTNATANRVGGNTNSAVALNSNQAPITNTYTGVNSNTTSSANSNFNNNMSRADYDRDRARYEAEARNSNRGTFGTGASDSWLWWKTRAALLSTNDIRESTINVDVIDGVVTLKGTVENQQQKAKAAQVAQNIEGKKSVVNQLTISANDSMMNTNVTGVNRPANVNGNKRP